MIALSALAALALLIAPAPSAAQCQPYGTLAFRSPVAAAPGLVATALVANLTLPRGIALDRRGTVLVIERGLGVSALTENDPSCAGWLRTLVVANANLTQGIQVHGTDLYVSTPGEVLRYAYDATTRTVAGVPVVIVTGIPPDGELATRPILLHPKKNPTEIIVSSPLATNIDPTARDPASGRSQLRSFPLTPGAPPASFLAGTLLAYGIRNPAGFAFWPAHSTALWTVENGASIDAVPGITPAFANDNPADELERADVALPARFFGFPDCTTLWNGTADPVGEPQYVGEPVGTQFSLGLEPERDDAWCGAPANNKPPRLSFQAHSVPLDIKFFVPHPAHAPAGLPVIWAGDAFVSFHGSFNRAPPTGYSVVRVPFGLTEPAAPPSSGAGYETLVQAANLTSCPGTCIRPVGLAFARDGRLFVSSDSSGELFVLESSV